MHYLVPMKFLLTLIIALFIGLNSLFAQTYPFRTYSIEEGLSESVVHDIIQDSDGYMWMATGFGLNKFDGLEFKYFYEEDGLLSSQTETVFEASDGKIWVGTLNGAQYIVDDSVYSDPNLKSLDEQTVINIYEDSEGGMWFATESNGVWHYINNRIEIYTTNNGLAGNQVRDITETGDYWISTYDDGLIRWNERGYTQYTTEHGLPDNTVLASVESEDGSVWIATYGGVARMNGNSIEIYGVNEGVPNIGVMDILIDTNGTIWISTFNGIAWFDGVQFVDITFEDGLPGRVGYFIEQDSNGIFWIGTNNGIARLDINKYYSSEASVRDEAIQILQSEQGLIANEANLGAVYEDSDQHLWFGTVDGISKFYPEEYRGNQIPPRVKITDFRASGRSYLRENQMLEYDRDFIQIDFSAINFTAPNLVTYRYRMSNIDPEWQYTAERTARYPSLPSGAYTFEVQAQNSSGVWSYNTANIQFTLKPPFWFTWWFISIIIGAIAGIIYLFYRNYQFMKMVDIERMRVRIASDLHDDVGASLTEVALQSDFLQASSMDSEFKQSLTQIGQQCRKIVTSLDDIVWSIDARNDTLGDLTDRMQDYILNVLEPLNFEVSYNFDELKMEEKIPVPVKENLYLIFKEAINNIAKYSNGDKVEIGMQSNGSSFSFVIHDNGTSGKSTKKTGQGLRNMQMRAQRMNGSVDISDEEGFRIELNGKLTMN